MYKHGWFQVAYERDITDELTAVSIGTTRSIQKMAFRLTAQIAPTVAST